MLKDLQMYKQIEYALVEVSSELTKATSKFPPFHSAHEGYAVILEETDELKAEVFKRHKEIELMRKEAIQTAAMAVRFLIDVCYKGEVGEPKGDTKDG